MGAVLNGIALHSHTRPYGGTFLVFSDYMRPSVRLAALMEMPVTYVWTHDSIGLGEDGPDAPAGRAPRLAAGDPGSGRRTSRPTPTRPWWRGGRSSATPTGPQAWR
ncbi:MAG: hypothetical protein WKF83_04545 [Nocardioidaceae bacterium]